MSSETAVALARAMGGPAKRARLVPLGGGSFGWTGRLELDDRLFFLKALPAADSDPLDAEADGLKRLAAAAAFSNSDALRVPDVHGLVDLADQRFLVLEWLDLRHLSTAAASHLGRQLAHHHRRATAERHGLDRDNWIGGTPQINALSGDWTDFFFQHRLGYLIDRLGELGTRFDADTLERLRQAWVERFPDHQPVPSLLHGDLWSGNASMLADGTPVVFDPAVHYGDRECDLAMAALFGGFGPDFFAAYEDAWPLDPDWAHRRRFYQLYHVLNHALLFGRAYLDEARRRIEALTNA